MKKKIELKKLKLNKERIISLSTEQSAIIVGGKEAPKTQKSQQESCQSRVADAGCTVGNTDQ
jgi:hypothetical protein